MNMTDRVIQGLVARGLPLHMAQGIAANMIAESRLDPGINEIAPLVPGSRGGFGLNQWTGPRRRALEAAAAARGVPVSDLEFQLDYTMQELQGPERRAFQALQSARNAEDAARIYSQQFLRPGIPHLENRLAYARRIAGGEYPVQGTGEQPNALALGQGAQTQDARQNALAAAQERQQMNALAFLDRAKPQAFDMPALEMQAAPIAPVQARRFDYAPDFTPRTFRRT